MSMLSRFATLGGRIKDLYWASVSLLLNGDGTNGSQVFTDLSSSPNTITTYGNAQISTTTKKFGTGSMYFDGTGDYLVSTGSGGYDINLDMTWECWMMKTGSEMLSTCFLSFPKSDQTSFSAQLYVRANAAIRMTFQPGTALEDTSKANLNQWYYVAYTRQGSTGRLFVDGIQVASATDHTHTTTDNRVFIGANNGSFVHQGYVDDLRITKGIARYTANFTPPTAPLPIG